MRRMKNVITMKDFDFARLMNGSNGDDITEWFSDNDIYLSDIMQDEDIGVAPVRSRHAVK